MLGQPGVAFFVRAVVVQDHVPLPVRGRPGNHRIHEGQELLPPLERGGALSKPVATCSAANRLRVPWRL